MIFTIVIDTADPNGQERVERGTTSSVRA